LAAHLIICADAILCPKTSAKFDFRDIRLRQILWCVYIIGILGPDSAFAAERTSAPPAIVLSSTATNGPKFTVRDYRISDRIPQPIPDVSSLLARYTGTNVGLLELVKAASVLQSDYFKRGYSNVVVGISTNQITNGIITMNISRGTSPQVLVSGRRYSVPENEISFAAAETNRAASATNREPKFAIRAYEIKGDTLLSTETLTSILTKYTGTNIGVSDIMKAGSEVQMEYRTRGFPTVNVTIPPQQITNGIVKMRVFEGRLSEMSVVNNHYFSSNNVMRALPSLQTNMILNREVFQAELDRANANQDRQIYPELEPGAEENTTLLRLKVQDRLPLHAKMEFSNQSSPGTPELRLNSSMAYNNLWQLEHSMGVQYSFSPQVFKDADRWEFYDKPLVANYSGFYRMPLGNPEAIADVVAAGSGNFGYDEASRKFNLPPPSGRVELNIYGSRSTIDTGLETLLKKVIYDVPGVRQVFREDVQQDVTINEGLGARLSGPLPDFGPVHSTYSFGFDYKHYDLTSNKTNTFTFFEITLGPNNQPNPPIISTVSSPVPTTHRTVSYLPFTFRWDASERDDFGFSTFGMGYSANFWYSGSLSNLQAIAGSTRSTGRWLSANFSASRDQNIFTNWVLSLHADGQVASEPLISNEQFGLGGVAGVRGYREGEIFGDSGWRFTLEQKTPPVVVGPAYGRTPLTLRGSVYTDYGEDYLLDPNGRKGRIPLWGIGLGGVAAIGTHWEARFLVTWPILRTSLTEPYQPRFDFSLTGQF
jgi:hemolysin activation/secretion protein